MITTIFVFEDISVYYKKDGKVGEAIEIMTAFAGSIVLGKHIEMLRDELKKMLEECSIIGREVYKADHIRLGVGHSCLQGALNIIEEKKW